MNRLRSIGAGGRVWNVAGAGALATLLLSSAPVLAQEPGRSGFYFGGHMGYLFGNGTATLADPIGIQSAGGTTPYGTLYGGVHAGYEQHFASRLMLGLELDMSFPNYSDLANVLSYRATGTGTANEQLEYLASLRGRAGYDMGSWTPFVTGGIAWASTRYSRTDLTTGNEDASPGNIRVGWTVGGGLDYRLDPRWTTRFEYLYTNLGLSGFVFGSAPARYDSQYSLNQFRVGLNYKFGVEDEKKAKADDRGPGSWEIHGQTTFIYQGYPPIYALYSGTNSLPPEGQSRETWTVSGFLGVRLWQGGELYFNPEFLQGFGVANTVGAAGYPNGEAQKSNFPYPRFNVSRLFLRQEIGLVGETETVDSDYGQLSGVKDINRVTLQFGKYSVKDIFDTNAYANDPRIDFLNWSIWAAGAFDYPADRLGLTWGLTAELNRKDWSVRAGYFLVPFESNANTLDTALFVRGGYVGELEMRYRPFGQEGAFRLGTWLNSVYAGSYNQATVLANPDLGLNANDTIPWTRQGRTKYGLYLNFEQALSDSVGLFGRFSWNDGRNEIMSFTDIDTSLSLGVQIKGTLWGRPDDRVGIAGAWNNISGDHSAYLAAGGLGPLVGDGALSYASENVFEAYYAFQLAKGIVATADYQFLGNPAYNIVRGPVNVFSGRLRMSF
ncbi:carbohydrate porin [Reyranella soli]|nr:carbohydrate porin [Reyranella soli]